MIVCKDLRENVQIIDQSSIIFHCFMYKFIILAQVCMYVLNGFCFLKAPKSSAPKTQPPEKKSQTPDKQPQSQQSSSNTEDLLSLSK